ncbi:MAG: hypothetical protein JW976_01930 [Syntrophaceae bacterium]|nr:hypothetical protein [Syntrophaceae bacterium]
MENKTTKYRTAHGIVKNVFDDSVELLLQYNPEGESRLCCIPLKFWKDILPVPDQHVEISWDPNDEAREPEIKEVPQWLSKMPNSSELVLLRKLFGLDFSSKVLFVIGPNRPLVHEKADEMLRNNPETADYYQRLQSFVRLKTAGWGECLAITYLVPLLKYLGVAKIKFKLCESNFSNFNPQQYADYSIFFLGSTKSNEILREVYWEKFGLKNKYEFNDYELTVHLENGPPSLYRCADETHKVSIDKPELMHVKDYFILAKLPNPYSEEDVKPNCFIAAGIGTIGTGYAAVMLAVEKNTKFFLERFQENPFSLAGSVDMNGMFNPEKDPVSILFDGNRNEKLNEVLLPKALTALKIGSVYSEEDFQRDRKKLG